VTLRRVVVLAWKSLRLHRLRSLLTVLGIVFGVGSVVAMLAIGEGASREAQARIQRLGSRNLLLASVAPPAGEQVGQSVQRVLEYGLDRADVSRIRDTIPSVSGVVARRDIPKELRFGTRRVDGTVVGTDAAYAEVARLQVVAGRFLAPPDVEDRRPVCVLGSGVAERLFGPRDPVGTLLAAGTEPFRVIGVLAPRGEAQAGAAETDLAVFVPLEATDERYGETISSMRSGTFSLERVELHHVIVEAESTEAVPRVAEALRALVGRWHPRDDVRLTVPLELLEEARRTKREWTLILGAIAAISLLVGGIGIMNIMLASVLERTREVGIRRALGARKRHIVVHFLAETVLLSVGGGLLGLLLGIAIPIAITRFFAMSTHVTPESLVLAFGISALVGVVFGLYPAARAAELDPVEALRRE
jgi:putative ABC transport system permease protein